MDPRERRMLEILNQNQQLAEELKGLVGEPSPNEFRTYTMAEADAYIKKRRESA